MRKAIRGLLWVFFVAVLVFSLGKLWGMYTQYREGRESYDALEQYVSFAQTQPQTLETDPTLESVEETQPPDLSAFPEVDFEQLSQINSDIVGWIVIENTNIHYPVVQAENNSYYLDRLFDRSFNSSGSIFLDAGCASDFSDRHSILYGHHMKDGSMFQPLMNYKNQRFYDEHLRGLLVTPDAYYTIQFFSGYVCNTWQDAWERQFTEPEFISWLDAIGQRSCFAAESFPTKEDRIVTLSTCTYEFDTAKFVLHGYISEVIANN